MLLREKQVDVAALAQREPQLLRRFRQLLFQSFNLLRDVFEFALRELARFREFMSVLSALPTAGRFSTATLVIPLFFAIGLPQ